MVSYLAQISNTCLLKIDTVMNYMLLFGHPSTSGEATSGFILLQKIEKRGMKKYDRERYKVPC